jgi:hypothetical protein
MGQITTYTTSVELNLLGGETIKLPLEVDYVWRDALPETPTDPEEPAFADIVAYRYKINGQFIGVEELALPEETLGCIAWEIARSEHWQRTNSRAYSIVLGAAHG